MQLRRPPFAKIIKTCIRAAGALLVSDHGEVRVRRAGDLVSCARDPLGTNTRRRGGQAAAGPLASGDTAADERLSGGQLGEHVAQRRDRIGLDDAGLRRGRVHRRDRRGVGGRVRAVYWRSRQRCERRRRQQQAGQFRLVNVRRLRVCPSGLGSALAGHHCLTSICYARLASSTAQKSAMIPEYRFYTCDVLG